MYVHHFLKLATEKLAWLFGSHKGLMHRRKLKVHQNVTLEMVIKWESLRR